MARHRTIRFIFIAALASALIGCASPASTPLNTPALAVPAEAPARTGFVEVSEARSDWAPDPANPLPKFNPPRRVPHGVTLIGRLFDEGTIVRAGMALERASAVASERPAILGGP